MIDQRRCLSTYGSALKTDPEDHGIGVGYGKSDCKGCIISGTEIVASNTRGYASYTQEG